MDKINLNTNECKGSNCLIIYNLCFVQLSRVDVWIWVDIQIKVAHSYGSDFSYLNPESYHAS